MMHDSYRGVRIYCGQLLVKVITKVPQNLLFSINETKSEVSVSILRVADPLVEEEKRQILEVLGGNFRTDNPNVIYSVCYVLVDVAADND